MLFPHSVRFSLSGTLQDAAITPGTLDLHHLHRFTREVEQLLLGTEHWARTKETAVAVEAGSYVLHVAMPPELFRTFNQDMHRLNNTPRGLFEMDSKRAAVVQAWQEWAHREGTIEFTVSTDQGGAFPTLHITPQTFFLPPTDQWVRVEKYIRGFVEEMGGSSRINLHMRLATGQLITVESAQDYLRDQTENHLYHTKLLRVEAEQNLRTQELRHIHLLEFIEHQPAFDETELDRLVEQATRAWSHADDTGERLRTATRH